jgi:hypothetical protein
MKKIIVIVLMVVAIAGFGDSWLSVDVTGQVGYIPYGNIDLYQQSFEALSAPFDFVCKIDAKAFSIVKFGGSLTSLFSWSDKGKSIINFMPTGMTYQVYIGIEFIEGISINYEHSCSHPVVPYVSETYGNPAITAGYDRVYLEIKGHLDF